MPHRRSVARALAFLLPLLIGAGMAAWLVAHRTPAQKETATEAATAALVVAAPQVRWVPRALGYGEASPARTWRGIAEVAGNIVDQHPKLDTGAILPGGALLFQIDRTDYELALDEAEAAIAAREAQVAELDTRIENVRRSLAVERRRLEPARREYERLQTLFEQGTVSRSALDGQLREYLQQRQAVLDFENTLAQLPAERERLKAEVTRDRVRREQSRRDLARTRITAPFAMRVSAVGAETGQYVATGETLMEGDTVSATEVEAEVPVDQFRALLDPARRPPESVAPERLDDLLPRMGLTAEVRLRTPGGRRSLASWSARVDRISDAIDPRTRTVGVVAVVDRPYADARPPEKPPLVKGMYVEVRLCAPARTRAVVVPRTALHQGRVYVADANDRLAIREVDVRYRHDGFAVIANGLATGERVVVSDPVPAIAGMKLAPQADSAAEAALLADARGTHACP